MASERRANGQDEPFNVKYWGIGNEAWGCGGSMRAEYYADLCRQYSTYLRNYSPEHKIFKIASGANVADYHWTKTVMERAGQAVDAVSLHYYTLPHQDWQHKGSATDFTDEEYYTTLHKTLRMEELVENHTRIIKQYQNSKTFRPAGNSLRAAERKKVVLAAWAERRRFAVTATTAGLRYSPRSFTNISETA